MGGGASLAVIMPAYNEEGSIAGAVEEVRQLVLAAVPDAGLWVVDDGSRDQTGAILDGLAATDRRLHVIHQPNGGHGAALIAGMAHSQGEWMLLLDSDQQILLDNFTVAWGQREGLDALFGRRLRRDDSWIRKAITAGLKAAVQGLFGMPIADPNAPFKLVRRALWEEARGMMPAGCLIPSVFLAVYAHRAHWRWASFDVAYRERRTGQPSLRKLRLAKFSLHAFVQMLAFRKTLSRQSRAMRTAEQQRQVNDRGR
jgi:glycosyltransferase involved in cell wall biosynthesis